MVFIQHSFLILLIAFTPVMNQPKFVPRFKYYPIKDETENLEDENRQINVFQGLSENSVAVFELIRKDRFCRVYMWFGVKSRYAVREKAIFIAAKSIVEISNLLICTTFRVIREIPGHETDDFKRTLNIRPYSFPPMRIYMVKGGTNVVINQVPPRLSSFNLNDVFVVQGERGIYTFTGSNASKEEKIASKNLTEYIKNHDLHDYQNANEAKEIEWQAILDEKHPPEENEKWITFISMFDDGVEYFLKFGILEDHEYNDLEYAHQRYNKVKLIRYNNSDGSALLETNLTLVNILKANDKHTYLLTDELSQKTALVYIGANSKLEAIKKAFLEAEMQKLKDISYEIIIIQRPYFYTMFLVSFKDYSQFL